MTIFNLLLLVLVLVFSTESMAAPRGGSRRTVPHTEYQLVLQWPTSFCNTHYCDYHPIPDNFTVHGLWLNKNSIPVICPTNSRTKLYLQPQISDIRQKMGTYWPNLQNQEHPEIFWLHEYARHGGCLEEFPNQMVYFNAALDIAYDIGDVMTMRLSKGQALEVGHPYHVKDFEHVTIGSRTLHPRLRCNKADGRPHHQLYEIVFCTDVYKNPKKCTSYNTRVCTGPFEIPGTGIGSSAISRALPLMQFTHFLLQIFLHFLLFNFNLLTYF